MAPRARKSLGGSKRVASGLATSASSPEQPTKRPTPSVSADGATSPAVVGELPSSASVPVGRPAAKAGASSASADGVTSATIRWRPKSTQGDLSNADLADLIRHVRCALPAGLRIAGVAAPQDIADAQPLHIAAEVAPDGIKSYKERWVPANCALSLKQTNLYEAGGSLLWVDPDLHSEIPRERPAWKVVLDFATAFFKVPDSMAGPGGVTLRLAGGTGHKGTHTRILFPIALECYLDEEPARLAVAYPTKVNLLSGHAMVYAWYISMWQALSSGDTRSVIILWETALTTTIRLRVESDLARLCLATMFLSEKYIAAAHGMTDSFVTFADKLAVVTSTWPAGRCRHLCFRKGPPLPSFSCPFALAQHAAHQSWSWTDGPALRTNGGGEGR